MKTDSELQRDVLDELKWEPSINAAHIGVSVNDGIVTLSGHVTSYWEKYVAERAAKRVYGVRGGRQRNRRQATRQQPRTDEDIATAAVNALKTNFSVPADKIKVTVSKGWLKLEGEVEWQFQREAAETQVRYLTGVNGVSNLIAVKPRVVPTELKAKIEDPFKRSAELDAKHVTVEVEGGMVTLRGAVHRSPRKRKPLVRPGQPPGSTCIENLIVVSS